MQIGAIAERVGLSLRTIRYYEEVGLVVPAQRSPGGFRLYSEDNAGQLLLIKRMKPLDFSLEQMRDLLDTLAALAETAATPEVDRQRRDELEERVATYRTIVEARVETMRADLARTEDLARLLGSPGMLLGGDRAAP